MTDKLMEIAATVARSDQRLIDLAKAVDKHDATTISALAVHARKINSLEVSRGRAKGMIAGVGSLGILATIASWFKYG